MTQITFTDLTVDNIINAAMGVNSRNDKSIRYRVIGDSTTLAEGGTIRAEDSSGCGYEVGTITRQLGVGQRVTVILVMHHERKLVAELVEELARTVAR
jgi:hypothetical protein